MDSGLGGFMKQARETEFRDYRGAADNSAPAPSVISNLRRPTSSLIASVAEAAVAEREYEAAGAIEAIRRASESLRHSEQRSGDLETKLQELSERSRSEMHAAEARVQAAEARAASEHARADAAERRLREAEERMSQILHVIQEEFAGKPRR